MGATSLIDSTITGGEQALINPMSSHSLYSGGGFSDVFPSPSYQYNAVSNYLKSHAPKYGASVFNSSGRGYPDVSALGLNLATVRNGAAQPVGGTSASAPIFASIINMLNEERLEIGKKPIGFLNPIIYKHPEMFNDVTVGSNPGCNTTGFPASPGWDPVTGMGTPNYEKMLEVFLALP